MRIAEVVKWKYHTLLVWNEVFCDISCSYCDKQFHLEKKEKENEDVDCAHLVFN